MAPFLALLLVAYPSMATTKETREFLRKGDRPAGLYEVEMQSDSAICGKVLQSLNKPYQLANNAYPLFLDPNVFSDVLLWSDLQIFWSRKAIHGFGMAQALDLAHADLANNHHRVAVYRWEYFESKRPVDSLIILPLSAEIWPPQNQLQSDNIIRDLIKRAGSLSDVIHDEILTALYPRDNAVAGDELDYNVLYVDHQTLLLAVASGEITDGLAKGRPFHVFVVQYDPSSDPLTNAQARPSIICELRGGAR